jgi:hypothetical protein
MDFTSFSQTQTLFENHLFKQALGKSFRFTNMPLVCRLAPRKNLALAMWPLAMAAGKFGKNPASRRRGWPGREWGQSRCSPGGRFAAET